MLTNLILFNFNSGFEPTLEVASSAFILKTCQRTILVSYEEIKIINLNDCDSYEVKKGKASYLFLLEVICGLKSKLLGENEIVSQFKSAYKEFIKTENLNTQLLLIIEKLFKDTKEIRTKYLIGLGQKTYASITRRKIVNDKKAKKVLILGSGQMAEDLINQFKKKCEIYICARNKNAIENLKLNHEINVIEWGDYKSIITFAHIANTIGAKEIIFNKVFFENWKNAHHDRTFVDLGSPSAIDTNLTVDDGIIRLENIFSEGAIKENHKKQQIVKAKNAMDGIVEKRQKVFEKKALYHIPNPGQAKYVRK